MKTAIAKLIEAGQGELALSSPEVLEAFLGFTQTYYPSRHFALEVVDHGDGWRGAVFDYNDDMQMFGPLRNEQYHDVFATLAQPIDVLGFDACLMQEASANTWWQLGGSKVKFSVASEQVQGVLGWNMDGVARRWAERRRQDGQMEPRAFAMDATDLCLALEQAFEEPTAVNTTARALRAAMQRAVVANASDSSTSHGVTLHLPKTGIAAALSQSEFEKHAAKVLELTPNWRAFLRSI